MGMREENIASLGEDILFDKHLQIRLGKDHGPGKCLGKRGQTGGNKSVS